MTCQVICWIVGLGLANVGAASMFNMPPPGPALLLAWIQQLVTRSVDW